ncbi:MAG: hypothetical protein C0608_06575 [Deltaproteobacteria bacterium]|nr:MAG: hypothetical protein C0608_06575 [Deltaproteobacteria bacterium]
MAKKNYGKLGRLILITFILISFASAAQAVEHLDAFMKGAKAGASATVEGVVSVVSPKGGRFGIIDSFEFASCKSVNCAKLTMPVIWGGALPAVASTVHVTGVVEEGKTGLVFTASAVKEVAPPPDKGTFK